MDNYIVSARKYRPATFHSVVGQKSLTTTLRNAILNHKLAHAYLFCGPRGVGKTTCARIFAKTINCFHPTAEGEACNECESCRSFNENRSLNIHELDAASNNSVDDIRALTDQVRILPQIGKYKVYIIDEVHMLSSQAFNAFLKTLEEPPHHAIFILATTEKHKILATILSRCQIYDFSRINIRDITEYLAYVAGQEKINFEPEALNVIAQKADGGMRDALSIFDQVVSFSQGNVTYRTVIDNLNVLDYDYYFRITEAVLKNDVRGSLLLLDDILRRGFDGQQILSGLALFFRDLLVCRDPQTIVLFEASETVREKYLTLSAQCQQNFLYKAMELTNETDLSYRLSKNKRFAIELLLVRLCQQTAPSTEVEDEKKKLKPIVTTDTKTGETAKSAENQSVNTSAKASAASENEPQKKPAPSHISIKRVSKSAQPAEADVTQKDEPATEPDNQLTSDFSTEQLAASWSKFAEQSSDNYLKNAMQSIVPELKENFTVEITVINPAQEEVFAAASPEISAFLRNSLGNGEISLVLKIRETQDDDRKQILNDKEKIAKMADANSELKEFVKELDLRLVNF